MSSLSFKIGDTVVYGNNGVCTVSDKTMISFAKSEPPKEYFLLTPCAGGKSTIYVPTDREELIARIHPLLDEKQISVALETVKQETLPGSMDKTTRNDMLNDAQKDGDRKRVLLLIRWLLHEERRQKSIGKKMLFSDENLMKAAMKTVEEEFAFVLKLSSEDAADYIKTALQA